MLLKIGKYPSMTPFKWSVSFPLSFLLIRFKISCLTSSGQMQLKEKVSNCAWFEELIFLTF